MASGTRTKIKEHIEGVHKNTEAIKQHCIKCLEIIADKNPQMTMSFRQLAKVTNMLDEFAQKIYSHL